MMYEELLKSLRICADGEHCDQCPVFGLSDEDFAKLKEFYDSLGNKDGET